MKASKFEGIFWHESRLATKGLTTEKVYGEYVVDGYRMWNPNRSKPAAAILNGLKSFPVKRRDKILYLGAGNGTTASHLSDIVGKGGAIYCIEFSARTMRDLVLVCEYRKNMVPILADANKPEDYEYVGKVDLVYQDVAQKNQADIFLRNCEKLLLKNGYAILMVKSRSIDVTMEPKDAYARIEKKLRKKMEILDMVKLDPYQKDHACFVCRLI